MRPIVWTIAGSDSGGGAGIQADLKTFFDLKVHGCSVITGVTAQNSVKVRDIHYLPVSQIEAQIQALNEDLPAKVIKTGMQGSVESLPYIGKFLQEFPGYVVCDPVRNASSGKLFLQSQQNFIQYILPHADLLTPNLAEAEWLTDIKINHYSDMILAAEKLLNLGAKSVLIKGGHAEDQPFCQDFWTNGQESFWLSSPRINHSNTHGSGCTLAAAITACLALGYELKDALVIAKMYVHQSIRLATQMGKGPGPVVQAGWPRMMEDLPYLTSAPIYSVPLSFARCDQIGLYPIVDSSEWVKTAALAGAPTIQLRIKNTMNLEQEIQTAIEVAKSFHCQLFINDHWQLAIKYGAFGVHLGQEDLATADLAAIQKAGIRLGVSTHCYYEVARAHAINPSYIACGPIFPTSTKIMNFAPQGVQQLKYWRELLSYPLVAVGGIDQTRINEIAQTGVDGIAMLSAITTARNPEATIKKLLIYTA